MKTPLALALAALCCAASAEVVSPPYAPVSPKSVSCATSRGPEVNLTLGLAGEDSFKLSIGADGTWSATLTDHSIVDKAVRSKTVTGLKCHFAADARLFGCEPATPSRALKKVMSKQVRENGVWENGFALAHEWIEVFVADSTQPSPLMTARFNSPSTECRAFF